MVIVQQNKKNIYSDGTDIEREMLRIANEYPEDLSQDYIANNSNYTINNTFSSVRQNILNWYPFSEHASILEVGAGMGAITGMLCDHAEYVTAIEMSQARAEVIKARYRDRKNLHVISENINTWETDQKFDYVIFIGVLEYAGVFSDNNKPYDEFLLSAKRLLKRNGKIIFAIENRFGLKYWLGASEDHLQKPFVGIEGYVGLKATPRTFSRGELEEILKRTGFKNYRFYSVLPDYKFPELIYADEYAPDYMNLKKVSFTYSKNSRLIADEKELYKDVIASGVFPFFANSFLVEASPEELDSRYVVHVSAKGEVYPKFRVSTVLDNEDHVFKIPMHKEGGVHINEIVENSNALVKRGIKMLPFRIENGNIVTDRYHGTMAQRVFQKALEDGDKGTCIRLIDSLKDNLFKSSDYTDYNSSNIIDKNRLWEEKVDYGIILQKAYVDMTFYNAFWENEELIFFDQEWCFDYVPLTFCLYYAIKSAYQKANVLTEITLQELLEYAGVKQSEKEVYDKLEEFIWSKVLYRQTDFYGEDGYCNRYSEAMTLREQDNIQQEQINIQQEQINIQQDQIEKITESREEYAQRFLKLERDYEQDRSSRAYQMAMKFREISHSILPVDSRRRFLVKMLLKGIRHPRWMFHMITPRRIYNFFVISKKEGMEKVYERYRLVEKHENSGLYSSESAQPEVLKVIDATNKTVEDYTKISFEKYEHPDISIVIPVYNQFGYTYNCLRSILKNSGGVHYEIIIADDCSTDLTKNIEEIVEGITIIRNEQNMRFLLSCNNATKYASGRYILFLNNDTQVLENWLQPLLDLAEADKRIGMVGSKLIYPDGRLQEAGGIIWRDGHAWNYGNGQNPAQPEFNYVKEVDYISGASIMIRTDLWKEIGGFDERFAPAYCEDSDMAFEVRKHGYKVVYQPKSEVVHFEGTSNGTDITVGQKRYQVENQKKLYIKWKEVLGGQHHENIKNVFLARDRGKDRKHILFIDHYVPQYDKDAGSKTTFMYLKMLTAKGFHITFLGDNFYQDEPYTTELQQMGIFVLYGPGYAKYYKNWLVENIDYFDIIYLNRPHITIKYIDFIKERAKGKIIYYGHDLHFLRNRREYEVTGNAKKLKEADHWKEQELYIMHKTDMNYYPSIVECNAIHEIDPLIPVRAITAYGYERFPEVNYHMEQREGILFVGGFGHDPNLDAVMWFLDKIYPEVYKRTNASFIIVGSKAPIALTKLKTKGVVVRGYVSEEELEKLYNGVRLVVVPLRYGAGIKGKVVEAMYYGTPLVTTSIGAEGIKGLENVAIVKDQEEELIEAICDVYMDLQKLEKMSEKSQLFAKQNYGIDAVWNIIKEDFS